MSSQCLELKSLKRSETSILKSLGYKSVFPLDAQLNLPADQYADGIRQQVAIEARKSSYDEAVESIKQTTGGYIPKRQGFSLKLKFATRRRGA